MSYDCVKESEECSEIRLVWAERDEQELKERQTTSKMVNKPGVSEGVVVPVG